MDSAAFVPGAKVAGHDGRPIGTLVRLVEGGDEPMLLIRLDGHDWEVPVPCTVIDTARSTGEAIHLPILIERSSRMTALVRSLRRILSGWRDETGRS